MATGGRCSSPQSCCRRDGKTGNRLGGGGPAGDHVSRLSYSLPPRSGQVARVPAHHWAWPRPALLGPVFWASGLVLCVSPGTAGAMACAGAPPPDTAPLLPLGPRFPRGAEQPEQGPSSRGGVPVRAESEPGRSCWLAEKRRIVTLFVTGPS